MPAPPDDPDGPCPAASDLPTAPPSSARIAWIGALGSFVIAALAGVLFRWGILRGALPAHIEFGHLRHAHSHLMYLGWLVPAIFLLMERGLAPHLHGQRDPTRGQRTLLPWVHASLVTGAITFPAFLAWGYAPVDIAGRSLPMAAILSGLCVFAWYGFAFGWWRLQRGLHRSTSLRTWNLALWMLLLASAGGWAQMAMNLQGIQHPFWSRATIHIFLDILALGFFVPAVLGALLALRPDRTRPGQGTPPLPDPGRALFLLALAIPFTFLLGMRPDQLPDAGRILGALAGMGTAVGLILLARPLWTGHDALVRPTPAGILSLGAVVAAALAVAGLPGVLERFHAWELRLPWLHLVFLGLLSPAAIHLARTHGLLRARHATAAALAAAILLLASLVPLTGLWPDALRGPWIATATLTAAIVPTGAYAWLLADSINARAPQP